MAFERFREVFGEGRRHGECTASDDARLEERLPPGLGDLLAVDGWCTYREGLFTTCDPDRMADVAGAWFPGPEVSVFAHDAFGGLYLWDGQEIGVLDPHIGRLDPLALDAEELLDLALPRPDYVAKAMFGTRVDRLRGILGAPDWDEIYGYEPALALGGSGKIETVVRVKMVEHLILLSQLVGIRD